MVCEKNMTKGIVIEAHQNLNIQGLANKMADVSCEMFANGMNYFVVSFSEHLPRLNRDNAYYSLLKAKSRMCVLY